MASTTRNKNIVRVLMFPWLAHGHISPFLQLSNKLIKANPNFQIYLCSTSPNLTSIKHDLAIQFVELCLPSLPNLPPHLHTTNGLPSHLMPTLKAAFDASAPGFESILRSLSPDLLIYDFLQPWAPQLAASLEIPAVEFICSSAIMSAFSIHFCNHGCRSHPVFPDTVLYDHEILAFDEIYGADEARIAVEQCYQRSSNIILIKSFEEIEGKYIEHLACMTGKRIIPVGPLVVINDKHELGNDEITNWLDAKEKSSVVFVSFGTEFFPSTELIDEIAHGLELSGANFIWVLRFPVGDEEKLLPEGFTERIGNRGMILDWAPQATILNHESVGGFVSHCGWSSVMEAMKCGVPIIAMPMQLDQPLNSRLVEELKIGVEVKRDGNGKVERGEMAEVIKEVLKGRNGGVRRNVKELSELIEKKGDAEIGEVVKELLKLCVKISVAG
ncbi:UDP-glucosyltransferase 29 [Linum perenne]